MTSQNADFTISRRSVLRSLQNELGVAAIEAVASEECDLDCDLPLDRECSEQLSPLALLLAIETESAKFADQDDVWFMNKLAQNAKRFGSLIDAIL